MAAKHALLRPNTSADLTSDRVFDDMLDDMPGRMFDRPGIWVSL